MFVKNFLKKNLKWLVYLVVFTFVFSRWCDFDISGFVILLSDFIENENAQFIVVDMLNFVWTWTSGTMFWKSWWNHVLKSAPSMNSQTDLVPPTSSIVAEIFRSPFKFTVLTSYSTMHWRHEGGGGQGAMVPHFIP